METLNFTNNSFVLYQILPDNKKIDFLNRSFDTDITKLSEQIYTQHFSSTFKKAEAMQEIAILSYITRDGDRVNIFFHRDYVHVNSNKLIPIHQLICAAMTDGNILLLDPDIKKTPENRERYHMRFYRAYKRITPMDKPLPNIIFS